MELNELEKALLDLDSKSASENIAPTIEEALAELEEIDGIDNAVKGKIKSYVNLCRTMQKRAEAGLVVPTLTHNMRFIGGSSEKRAELARAMARLFHALGIVEKGHIVEVKSKDLISKYVGQTAIFTINAVESAIGGLLFVDEVERLCPSSKEKLFFAEEALDTIYRLVEERRGDFVVIFSGEKETLEEFFSANQAFATKFPTAIDFDSEINE